MGELRGEVSASICSQEQDGDALRSTILHVIPGPRKRNPGSITADETG